MLRQRVRFIHSADLHLDSLFKTKGYLPDSLLERLRESTFEAFDRLIDACLKHHVDFLLITGDLYNEEIRSIKAQVHIRRGFERLKQENIHVYVSYGNHDYVEGTKMAIDMPSNVHIFSREIVEFFSFSKDDKVLAHIYGFSYETRVVRDRKVEAFQREGGADYHIGMLHGSLDTNTEHDVYAPFTLEELKKQKMDYWALGHIHKRSVLSTDPPVIYPGNIQGRSRKEMGEKGCYLVESISSEWNFRFLPLHSFTYQAVEVACDESETPEHIEKVLNQAKEKVSGDSSVILTVTLTANHGNLREWQSGGLLQEWIDVLNDSEDFDSDGWIWIEDIHIEDRVNWDEMELRKGSHFTGEMLRTISDLKEEELEEWLSPLYSHRKVSKYVRPLDDEEKQDKLENAKVLLLEKLMNGERGGPL